ncbi:DUF1542 domain-containing protein, partial [Staphylococcus epidermidis]|uniref:DUF1542 domain-containing protein n=1 Tax=Staphylococcus epidermidis TaxID=1282 RepID=UPI0011A1A2BC
MEINKRRDGREEEKEEGRNRVNGGLGEGIENINNGDSSEEVNECKRNSIGRMKSVQGNVMKKGTGI